MSKDKVSRTLDKAQKWEFQIWSEEDGDYVEVYLDDVVDIIDSIKFLEDQNKRYREALESISNGPGEVGCLELFAHKTLEGDPHESS